MGHNRQYTFDHNKHNGYTPCDILLQLYETDTFRTIAIREDDFNPWKICQALNAAYEAGRKDAMRDLRLVMGVDI